MVLYIFQYSNDSLAGPDPVPDLDAQFGVGRQDEIDAGAEANQSEAVSQLDGIVGLQTADDAACEYAGDLFDDDAALATADADDALFVLGGRHCQKGGVEVEKFVARTPLLFDS